MSSCRLFFLEQGGEEKKEVGKGGEKQRRKGSCRSSFVTSTSTWNSPVPTSPPFPSAPAHPRILPCGQVTQALVSSHLSEGPQHQAVYPKAHSERLWEWKPRPACGWAAADRPHPRRQGLRCQGRFQRLDSGGGGGRGGEGEYSCYSADSDACL